MSCDKKCDNIESKVNTTFANIQAYGIGGLVSYIGTGIAGILLLGPNDPTGLHYNSEMFIHTISGAIGAGIYTTYFADKVKKLLL